MKIVKTTPVLCVASIEESLLFWTKTLGYEKTVEVPHKDSLGFVILNKEGSEIMLQSFASVEADLPKIASLFKPGSICLYSDVDSIDAAVKALKDVEIIVPLRSTPYGAKEIWVRDRDGNILGFAQHQK